MSVPPRIIVIWSGSTTNIPAGWFLCDGNNFTPDLRDRFVVGIGDLYSLKNTGGSADAIVVSHNHTVQTSLETFSHTHDPWLRRTASSGTSGNAVGQANTTATLANISSSTSGNHSHTLSGGETGESGIGKNLPPYYALAYIMKGAN